MPSRTRLELVLLALVAVIAAPSDYAAQAQERRTPTYYNVSNNADRLELLELGSIAGSGANTTAVVVDVYRETENRGLSSTWQIDCVAARMSIVRIVEFTPDHSGTPTAVKTHPISPASSLRAGTLFNLACDGSGDLIASRTYFDDLPTIMRRFWR